MESTNRQTSYSVGVPVTFSFGGRKVTGVVVEDMGPIGMHGRKLFRVELPMDPFEPMVIEIPGDDLLPAAEGESAAPTIDTARIVSYLENGGLVSILRSNLSGGRNPPRVWLRLDTLGNVTHTFIEGRGIVGGATVPFLALHNDRIFTPSKDSVIEFLKCFGLSRSEARDVVAAIRTSP